MGLVVKWKSWKVQNYSEHLTMSVKGNLKFLFFLKLINLMKTYALSLAFLPRILIMILRKTTVEYYSDFLMLVAHWNSKRKAKVLISLKICLIPMMCLFLMLVASSLFG